jgi:hypothetical protein
MSDPFVPYARKYVGPDNTTSNGQDVYGYDLGFYLHGKTGMADGVGDQSEDAYPGDLLWGAEAATSSGAMSRGSATFTAPLPHHS